MGQNGVLIQLYDRGGLFDAVEAEARRRGGNGHCSRNSCADGMVVLPAVPTFPNRRADLSTNTQTHMHVIAPMASIRPLALLALCMIHT
ncbi:hypothetical protein PGIGA_G00004310 [Pangasianodon gigas]|uniref:Uncharacterized protein n=1 Tax=Pangasianodon gigas TaxID=30993 RepID=A0ACC5W6Q4_PANGG|nr:hypothetical protein [Pangasianodon gigas]